MAGVMKRLRIAVLGAGTMGLTYARNIAVMPELEAVGVCDADPERAELAAKLCGAHTAAYTDFDQLIALAQPEAVCVCLPTYLHKTYVLKLAALGIHVICEKPIALQVEDAREMEEACRQSGVRLFIGHVVRFFPNYTDALRTVKEGAIGKAGMAHLKRFGSFPVGAGSWYRDRSKSGNVIMDLMIHDIDYARSLFGEVDSVYARMSGPEHEQLQYAQVTLHFKDRQIAILDGMWGYAGPFTTQFEISGDGGVIRFHSGQVHSLQITKSEDDSQKRASVQVPSSPSMHDPYYYELAHFISCIQSGAEPLVTVQDAIEAVRIALAAQSSAQSGKPVRMEGFA
jgi:UDP-N-acetylglucosamine 3-dehydrogenase